MGTLEEYQPRLTAAVCQLHDGVMDVEAAPALSNDCIAAIHDIAPSEIGGAIAAAMRGSDARLDSEQTPTPGASERLHEAMATAGYGDVMAFPVLDQESAVLGVLIVFVARRGDIDDDVRNLLHELAQITSIAFDQHRLMQKLVEQAQYDPLTQLPNRSLLDDRLRQTMLDAGRKGRFVTVILLVFRGPIAGLFGAENLTRSLIFLFCFPVALASFFNGAIFVASASFNTLGRPSYSTWLSWGQNTLGTWPFVIVGGLLLDAPGVLIGQAIGSVVFATIAIWLGWRLIHNPPDDHGMQRHHHPLFGHGSLIAHTLNKHTGHR